LALVNLGCSEGYLSIGLLINTHLKAEDVLLSHIIRFISRSYFQLSSTFVTHFVSPPTSFREINKLPLLNLSLDTSLDHQIKMNYRLIALVVLGLFLNSCNGCLVFLGDLKRSPNTGIIHLVGEVLENRVRVCAINSELKTSPVWLQCITNQYSAAVSNDFTRFAYSHGSAEYRLDVTKTVRERLLGDAIRWTLKGQGYGC
jgi:hypothetical protein